MYIILDELLQIGFELGFFWNVK